MPNISKPETSGNLRALAWVIAQQDEPPLDYIDLSQAVPRPKYWRASHRDVLSNEVPFSDLPPAIWMTVDESGEAHS